MATSTDTAPAPREPIDIQAIVAQIDRDLTESRRAREESFKLMAERQKLDTEQTKLQTEERKLRRDMWLAPWALGAAILGGLIVAVANRLLG
jgi:hypothetical protein